VFARDTQPLVEYYAAGRATARWTARNARRGVRRLDRGGDGGGPVIVCKSLAELERMRPANVLVADVLAECGGWSARASRRPSSTPSPSSESGRRAECGVQGIPRLPGHAVHLRERGSDSRHPGAEALLDGDVVSIDLGVVLAGSSVTRR